MMTLPPQPHVPGGPPEHSPTPSGERRCSGCTTPLTRMGPQPFRTGGVTGYPDAVMWVDIYWCPGCGKVEMFTMQ